MGKFHEHNEIVSWQFHKSKNQWFIVNEDRSISPCAAQEMVWGVRESDGGLVLVKKGASNQLRFLNIPVGSKPTNF